MGGIEKTFTREAMRGIQLRYFECRVRIGFLVEFAAFEWSVPVLETR